MKLNRRQLFAGLASTLAIVFRGAVIFGKKSETADLVSLADRLRRKYLDMVGSRESAAAIGSAYIQLCQEDCTERVLVRRIRHRLRQIAPNTFQSMDPIRDPPIRLDGAIEADFVSGETFRLQGWVLSRTECRLCALIEIA